MNNPPAATAGYAFGATPGRPQQQHHQQPIISPVLLRWVKFVIAVFVLTIVTIIVQDLTTQFFGPPRLARKNLDAPSPHPRRRAEETPSLRSAEETPSLRSASLLEAPSEAAMPKRLGPPSSVPPDAALYCGCEAPPLQFLAPHPPQNPFAPHHYGLAASLGAPLFAAATPTFLPPPYVIVLEPPSLRSAALLTVHDESSWPLLPRSASNLLRNGKCMCSTKRKHSNGGQRNRPNRRQKQHVGIHKRS
jgi:hypothetical protein